MENWIPLTHDGLFLGWIHPRTRRDILNQIDIEAFEEWRDRPDPDETRILEKLANEITKSR